MQCAGRQVLLKHGKLQSDGPLHSSPGLVKSYHKQPILQQSKQYDLPWSCTQPTDILQALRVMGAMGNVMLKCFMKLSNGHISTMRRVLFGPLHKLCVKLSIASCCFHVYCLLQRSCTFSWHS
jgi:hypothetical protein